VFNGRDFTEENGITWIGTRGTSIRLSYFLLSSFANIVLPEEMASLIALEFGFEPHVDAQAAFDLFPQYNPIALTANLDPCPKIPPASPSAPQS